MYLEFNKTNMLKIMPKYWDFLYFEQFSAYDLMIRSFTGNLYTSPGTLEIGTRSAPNSQLPTPNYNGGS